MVENFDEWFHDILEKANITDSRYPIKGMAIWMPYGFQIRKYTMEIIKRLLDKDHDEVLFPMLIPETELAKEGIHVKGFEDEVYWITKGGQTELNEQLALRPTSETAMYPMPTKINTICGNIEKNIAGMTPNSASNHKTP